MQQYLPSIYDEPFQSLQKVVRLAGIGSANPLTEARDRALTKVYTEIDRIVLHASVRRPAEETPEEEVRNLDDRASLLANRFVESTEGLILPAEDQADFKQIILEATTLFDGVLGSDNPFSREVNQSVTKGSGGFFDSPSYQCVREVQRVFRAALRELERRRATAPRASSGKKPDRYVADRRVQKGPKKGSPKGSNLR